MENLQRRASGIYVTRLTVPVHLRPIVGKREFVASTGTHHLAVAKLVAATLLARWRQQFPDPKRLTLFSSPMDHDRIIKLFDGHPLLMGKGYRRACLLVIAMIAKDLTHTRIMIKNSMLVA